jgi:hypothetical protein
MKLRCVGRRCSLLAPAAAAIQLAGYADGLCLCREGLERAERLQALRKALHRPIRHHANHGRSCHVKASQRVKASCLRRSEA